VSVHADRIVFQNQISLCVEKPSFARGEQSRCAGRRPIIQSQCLIGVGPHLEQIVLTENPTLLQAGCTKPYTNNLDPESIKLFLAVAVPATFYRSPRGVGEWEEPHHRGLAHQIGLRPLSVIVIKSLKYGGRQCHWRNSSVQIESAEIGQTGLGCPRIDPGIGTGIRRWFGGSLLCHLGHDLRRRFDIRFWATGIGHRQIGYCTLIRGCIHAWRIRIRRRCSDFRRAILGSIRSRLIRFSAAGDQDKSSHKKKPTHPDVLTLNWIAYEHTVKKTKWGRNSPPRSQGVSADVSGAIGCFAGTGL